MANSILIYTLYCLNLKNQNKMHFERYRDQYFPMFFKKISPLFLW